ncbi:Gfo/Idh/MocA family oxidoreductase [Flavobacteriaceae bacterium]|jgi:predicted dehydrogenase|nr:Gfo/Idh/MocA family oxidoreductase [Flavobacteriaceae bacterium]|tara:strand:+ start:5036 stop:6001 length:966 start_codon:yes stop_codon:yes gene_type:complete
MIKAGVLGAGHLGKIHLRLLNESDRYELIGFYDPDKKNAQIVSKEKGYKYFDTPEALVKAVDMVDIVTPTLSHHEMAMLSLKHGKQIFIEKPIANNVDEANEVTDFAKANNLLGQVGHVERFNPAFKAAISSITDPMFIESHRLSEFNPRGTDVPVVLDLMIHDIDIVLSLVKSPIKSVSASGVSVISATPDIANARIEFENGCVANLTASRISLKTMRKTRFFQKDAYISVDFLEKKVEIVKMKDAPKELADFAMILQNAEGKKKQIYFENPKIETSNAILEELESFADAIENQTTPIVSLENGTKALEVANMIIDSYSS